MPMRGILNVTYYSGEGIGKRNCRPNVNYRKSLTNLCKLYSFILASVLPRSYFYLLYSIGLIEEREIDFESNLLIRGGDPKELDGYKILKSNLMFWGSYLAPNRVDPNRKR